MLLTSAGCRSYGGYDTEEANMQAILLANEAFEQDLRVAQDNARQLEAASSPQSADQLEAFRSIVAAHETILEEHKQWAADLSPSDNTYRSIARVLGAILAEQEMVRLRYEDLLSGATPVADPRLLSYWNQLPDARYVVAPPFYKRQMEVARVQAMPGSGDTQGVTGSQPDTTTGSVPAPGTNSASGDTSAVGPAAAQ